MNDKNFPRLLIVTEKHGSVYYHVQDETTLNNICHEIVIERNNEGCWYESMNPKDVSKLKEAIENSMKSYEFLKSRRNAEYEFIELVQYEN